MKIRSLAHAGRAPGQLAFVLVIGLAACSSSGTPGDGEGGSGGNGGIAGAGAGGSGGTGGMGGSSASSGTLATSAADGCVYAYTPVPNCDGTGKPYYWECAANPTTAPAAGCEPPVNATVGSWCCPSPFCSRNTGMDSICSLLYATAPSGYLCAPATPGLAKCSGPPSPSTPSVYCCP